MVKAMRVFLCVCFVFGLSQAVFAVTYTVTKTADTNDGVCDSDCSFREAVAVANGTVDNDVIAFASPLFSTPQTITLGGTEIVINNNGSLTINGAGADKLTISGNNASRILSVSAGAVVGINNIRFTAGTGVGAANTGRGGAIYNNGGVTTITNCLITGNTAANGGGLNNASSGNLTIINSEISNNTTSGAGGGMQNFSGSTLTIRDSSIIRNTCNSTLTGGGGMQGNGTIALSNVTISGNNAAGGDGGAMYYNGQGLTTNNVTIANNTSSGTGGLHKSTSTNNANIRNTIIGGNTGGASPDATNVFNSLGNNVIGNVGTSTGWVASDLQNQNPLVSPLGYYGGFSMTHALLSGSPAIDAGQNCVTNVSCSANNPPVALTTDARGATRPTNTTVDIGAFEVSSSYVANLPNGKTNQSYSFVISPNNGSFTYAVTSGSLPSGLNLTSAFADEKSEFVPEAVVSIAGTPTQTGTFDFAITVTNGANSSVTNYRLIVLTDAISVSVGGRVLAFPENGLSGAIVTMTGPGGTRTAISSSLGYYKFENVTVGEAVTVSVSSKRYAFQSQAIIVSGEITNLDFMPQP